MQQQCRIIGLADMGVVSVQGSDAARFLQGQLSCDMQLLDSHRSLLAGYHNPQGRTIAVLRLVQVDAQHILAVLPRELTSSVAQRLARFVLRAKAAVHEESDQWRVNGLLRTTEAGHAHATAAQAAVLNGLPMEPGAQDIVQGTLRVRLGNEHADAAVERWLLLSPATQAEPLAELSRGARLEWRRLDVLAGRAQVYGATSEKFVAQMLNLDAVGAIAFDKGCYTGQEVIARAHYRGRVKRRMQRFISLAPAQLHPGDGGQLADGRPFEVVEAVELPDGRCDFLAVAPTAASGEAAGQQGLMVDPGTMPYPLPQ